MTTIKERAKALLDNIGSLTVAARAVAMKDGKPTKAEIAALEEAQAAVAPDAEPDHSEALALDREKAALHLETLAATVYEGQARGALTNAAADLREGRHIPPEPEAE